MANSLMKPESVEIYIPEAIAEENVTLYIIHLRVGRVEWTVRHRYREFVEVSYHYKYTHLAKIKFFAFSNYICYD